MAKKTAIQNFKITPETKDEFALLCAKNHTTPSHELNRFVHVRIEQFKNK